jgi:hypothetical protein
MNIAPRIAHIQVSVFAAFLASGGLKAGTPSEIASTPVSAAEPAVKARRINQTERPCVTFTASRGALTGTSPPVSERKTPRKTSTAMLRMKR